MSELHPDLQAAIREAEGSLPAMIHHPRMVELFWDDELLVAHCNKRYEQLSAHYQQAVDRGDHGAAIMLFTARPYRSQELDLLAPRMTDPEYWGLIATVWVDQENPEDYPVEWLARFLANRGHREHLMKPAEHQALAALPEVVEIYRGGPDTTGFSWTTDPEVARFFARRWSASDPIWRSSVRREHIYAYWLGRSESEVLVLDRRHLTTPEVMSDE